MISLWLFGKMPRYIFVLWYRHRKIYGYGVILEKRIGKSDKWKIVFANKNMKNYLMIEK